MNVITTWVDGRSATYSGLIVGNHASIQYIITSIGTQGGCVGDNGTNSGDVTELQAINPGDERTYTVKGGSVWSRYKGSPAVSYFIQHVLNLIEFHN